MERFFIFMSYPEWVHSEWFRKWEELAGIEDREKEYSPASRVGGQPKWSRQSSHEAPDSGNESPPSTNQIKNSDSDPFAGE